MKKFLEEYEKAKEKQALEVEKILGITPETRPSIKSFFSGKGYGENGEEITSN